MVSLISHRFHTDFVVKSAWITSRMVNPLEKRLGNLENQSIYKALHINECKSIDPE